MNKLELKNKKEILEKLDRWELRGVRIASGVVTIPHDFKYLDIGTHTEECQYASVVANTKADKMNIPHFIFFHNEPYMSVFFKRRVYKKLEKAYPRYQKLKEMEITFKPETDIEYEMFKAAPQFGIFKVPREWELQDRLAYNPNYRVPYDAIILTEEDIRQHYFLTHKEQPV